MAKKDKDNDDNDNSEDNEDNKDNEGNFCNDENDGNEETEGNKDNDGNDNDNKYVFVFVFVYVFVYLYICVFAQIVCLYWYLCSLIHCIFSVDVTQVRDARKLLSAAAQPSHKLPDLPSHKLFAIIAISNDIIALALALALAFS